MVYIKRRDKIYRFVLKFIAVMKGILKIQSKGDQMKTIKLYFPLAAVALIFGSIKQAMDCVIFL